MTRKPGHQGVAYLPDFTHSQQRHTMVHSLWMNFSCEFWFILRRKPHPSEPLEFWCMLAPWMPTFPVQPDPRLLEVFAIGAAVLV